MREPKMVRIQYEVNVATFNQQGLLDAREKLYELFNEVFYNSAGDVAGVDFLVESTQLKMDGKTG